MSFFNSIVNKSIEYCHRWNCDSHKWKSQCKLNLSLQRTSYLAISFFLIGSLTSCAGYRVGQAARSVPGGYKKIAIPMFRNKTQETGVEVSFTNSIITEFQRSHVADVVPESLSDARIEGTITSIQYRATAQQQSGDASAPYLPMGSVLTTEYQILVQVELVVKRNSDGRILWNGSFQGEQTYAAPRVTLSGVNSVNPLYNLSARRQNIELIAKNTMAEAHDRLTENF